jgi:hypothetical protein
MVATIVGQQLKLAYSRLLRLGEPLFFEVIVTLAVDWNRLAAMIDDRDAPRYRKTTANPGNSKLLCRGEFLYAAALVRPGAE